MLHIYASVSNVFIRMLQVVSSECLQWLYTWFSSFFWYFTSVSDLCCKCFNYFGRMLQMCPLNIAKADLDDVAHGAVGPICSSCLLQLLGPPACAWVWRGACGKPCGRRSRWSNAGHGSGAGHGAARDTMRVWDTERHGPHVKQHRRAAWR
jgi:hypothetical protein